MSYNLYNLANMFNNVLKIYEKMFNPKYYHICLQKIIKWKVELDERKTKLVLTFKF